MQREERIKRNSEFIRQLGLKKLVTDLTDCLQRTSSAGVDAQRRGPRPKCQPQQPLEPVVVRKSCRQRGLAPDEDDAEEARHEAETSRGPAPLLGCLRILKGWQDEHLFFAYGYLQCGGTELL